MLTLFLAASLWTASQEPGVQPLMVTTIERLADPLARDISWIASGVAGDLLSTSWALRRCQTCREANVLGPDVESRIALQIGGGVGSAVACYELRRAGKPKLASVVRWAFVAFKVYAAGTNAYHAIRRR